MTLQTVAAMAQVGADFISVGALDPFPRPQPTSAWISQHSEGRRGQVPLIRRFPLLSTLIASKPPCAPTPSADHCAIQPRPRPQCRCSRILQQSATKPALMDWSVLADCQTAGRGRRGRTWHSPPQGNLYLGHRGASTCRHRHNSLADLDSLLSALAGPTASLNKPGLPVSVKWPNDLLIPTKGRRHPV